MPQCGYVRALLFGLYLQKVSAPRSSKFYSKKSKSKNVNTGPTDKYGTNLISNRRLLSARNNMHT